MISLLLAIRKKGIDIDAIYEQDVINKNNHDVQNRHKNIYDEIDDDGDVDDEDINIDGTNTNGNRGCLFLNNVKSSVSDEDKM